MKKIICLLTFIMAIHFYSQAKDHPVVKPVIKLNADPRCTFDKIWVDYDLTENGYKGMRVHVKFTAYDMMNMDAYLAIYFQYDDEEAEYLRDRNDKFNSSEGDVAVYQSIKPQYNPAVYSDLQVFMPYSELDLDAGEYNLTMDVKIIYQKGGVISRLTKYDFEYTKPTSSTTNSTGDASLDKVWVDYNVTQNGKKGMRIHVKFTVYNMKDVDSYLAIYFEKENGDKVYSNNTSYRSTTGQLALYKSLKPGYATAVYDDMQLFMPYEEFNLGTGKWDLKMDVDVIYKNGDMVKHLKYHDFWIQ